MNGKPEKPNIRPGMQSPAVKRQMNAQGAQQSRPVQKNNADAAVQTEVKPAAKTKSKKDVVGNSVISAVKAVTYILIILIVSAVIAGAVIAVGNDVFAFVKSDEIKEVRMPDTPTIDDVAETLGMNGIIKYPFAFKLYAKFTHDDGNFVGGEYTVSPSMDYEDLLDAFKEKKPTGTIRLTIPEGYTTDEIIDLFVSNGIGTKEGFIDVINNYEFNYWFIDELNESGWSENRFYRLDGYLFPDTYDFYLTSSEETVINKLLKRFKQMYTLKMKNSATTLGYTTDEIVTIASMIEKESKLTTDRANISSVFNNRLSNSWAFPYLQSDATVMYAIHHDTGERKKQLTEEDKYYETPYNTYLYRGMPPGPIANPGYSSLMYALSPGDTKYFYFVTDNKGVAHFAETLEEHNQNVYDYLINPKDDEEE